MFRKLSQSRDYLDKWFFIFIFLCGTISIIALKMLSFHQAIVTSTPVILMLIYFFYVIFSNEFKLRDDKAGDNIYYLGLLFTLVSLALSLYSFSANEGNTHKIIVNFGIALASTITGLALRVLLIQMRQDSDVTEAAVRDSLVKTTKEITIELNSCCLQVKQFSGAIIQQFNEIQNNQTQLLNENLKKSLDHFMDTAKKISTELQISTTSSSQKIDDISKTIQNNLTQNTEMFSTTAERILNTITTTFNQYDENAKKLTKASTKTVNSAEKLSEKIASIDLPINLFEQKFDNVIHMLSDETKKLISSTTENFKLHSAFNNSLNKTSEQAGLIQEKLISFTEHFKNIEQLSTTVIKLNDNLNEFNNLTNTQMQSFNNFIGTAKNDLALITNHRSALEKELEKSRLAVSSVHTSLTSLASTVIEKLR